MKRSFILLALLAARCTTASDLPYTPAAAPVASGLPAISAVTVQDARNEPDPTFVGAIRGGFGNRLKTLRTAKPVEDVVRAAFEAALAARGLLGREGGETLNVQVTRLEVEQVARREAWASLAVTLRRRDGAPVYSDAVAVDKINGSIITLDKGVFASTDDLRAILAQAMSEAIDQALDKPGFVAATRPGR